MSIVGAIGSIRVILAESAPIASVRNAWRGFKSAFGNIPSKSLASREVKAAPKAEGKKVLPVVTEVTEFLNFVAGRVRDDQPQNNDEFTARAHILLDQKYTKQELGDVLTKTQSLKKKGVSLKLDRDGALVLQVLQKHMAAKSSLPSGAVNQPKMSHLSEDQKADLREMEAAIPQTIYHGTKVGGVEEKLDLLARYFELKLSPEEQTNDLKFQFGVLKEFQLIMRNQDKGSEFPLSGERLAQFVAKAKGITLEDRHSEIVLNVMNQLAAKPTSEWLSPKR
jgi:hypothetical protein